MRVKAAYCPAEAFTKKLVRVAWKADRAGVLGGDPQGEGHRQVAQADGDPHPHPPG